MSEMRSDANCDDQNPRYMVELNLITQLRSAATKTEGDIGTLSVPSAQMYLSISWFDSRQFVG